MYIHLYTLLQYSCTLSSSQTFYEIRRPTPDTPWPLPRTFHPICSLNPPCTRAEDNSGTCAQVFVLWGRNTKSSVADEAGILTFNKDVTEVSYKKVNKYNSVHVREDSTVYVCFISRLMWSLYANGLYTVEYVLKTTSTQRPPVLSDHSHTI